MTEELHQAARKEMARAVRRLGALELVMMAGSMVLALLGGALLGLLLEAGVGLPFRATWIVASILLFVVPGALVLGRERRSERDEGRHRDTDESSKGRYG